MPSIKEPTYIALLAHAGGTVTLTNFAELV